MKYLLKIEGLASNRVVKTIEITSLQLEENLMDFLLAHSVPVASSCSGKGVCKKCICIYRDSEILTCQKSLIHLFSKEREVTIYFKHL